jgi:hypothetical protein
VQLGELAWLASTIFELRTKHVPIGNLVLDQLPAFGSKPLTSFKLSAESPVENDYPREPDYPAIAASVVSATTEGHLTALIENWWAEAEPALQFLQKKGHGPMRRPCAALHESMQAVVGRGWIAEFHAEVDGITTF